MLLHKTIAHSCTTDTHFEQLEQAIMAIPYTPRRLSPLANTPHKKGPTPLPAISITSVSLASTPSTPLTPKSQTCAIL